MSSSQEVPVTGFSLDKVYCSEQFAKVVPPDDLPQGPDPQIGLGWDWRIVGPRTFEVMLRVSLSPTRARPEEVRVTLCGLFKIIGPSTSVNVRDFVRLQGPAILMPYLREGVSSLTGHGYFGQWILPPFNVHLLMQQQKAEEAIGSRQLESSEGRKLLSS